MTPQEFFQKVVEMRQAQKRYFKMRTSLDLAQSKKLEKEIDNEIERVNQILSKRNEPTQEDLFPEMT
jgi:hypothetical protein